MATTAHIKKEVKLEFMLPLRKAPGDAECAVSVSMETEDRTTLKYYRTDRREGECRRVSGNASSQSDSGRM